MTHIFIDIIIFDVINTLLKSSEHITNNNTIVRLIMNASTINECDTPVFIYKTEQAYNKLITI